VSGSANRLAIWTAQYLLGNGPHVVLTFLLFAVHRDVLTAEPRQPRHVLLGSLGMLGVGGLLFALYYADATGYAYVVGVLFNVFGPHHILSQCKGFWALHTLRGFQAGLSTPAPLERRLQVWFVPVMLTLVLVRLFFVAESPRPGDTPYLDIEQGTPLPHGAMAVLLTVWLGYFGLLFRTLPRSGTASGPKVLSTSSPSPWPRGSPWWRPPGATSCCPACMASSPTCSPPACWSRARETRPPA